MRIQHNIAAMNSYRNYTNNNNALAKNLEKLSSGYKINRAGDDAAGLAISEKMRAQIAGLDQAQANVKDGISLVKTAEGALQEVHDMLNRMTTLATQSANGTYDDDVDRLNLQKEVTALKDEIDRIASSSNYNGQKLLDGSIGGRAVTLGSKGYNANAIKNIQVTGGGDGAPKKTPALEFAVNNGTVTINDKNKPDGITWEAVGSDTVGENGGVVTFKAVVDRTNTSALGVDLDYYDGMTISVTVDAAKTDGTWDTKETVVEGIGDSTGMTLQIGDTADIYNQMKVNVGDMHTKALNIDSVDISSRQGAEIAIKTIKDAINHVSSTRGDLGAIQNRLEHTQNNLSVMTENIQDAESTIRDTDIADEMTTYTKNNILLQSAQAMLAQANQMPQGVLQLLQ